MRIEVSNGDIISLPNMKQCTVYVREENINNEECGDMFGAYIFSLFFVAIFLIAYGYYNLVIKG